MTSLTEKRNSAGKRYAAAVSELRAAFADLTDAALMASPQLAPYAGSNPAFGAFHFTIL